MSFKSWDSFESVDQQGQEKIFSILKKFMKKYFITLVVQKNQTKLDQVTLNPLIDLQKIYSNLSDLQFFQQIQKSQYYMSYFERTIQY